MQFIDLQAQRRRIEPEINAAIQAVVEHGRFVMGPEVAQLEAALGRYGAAERVITCANGTEALALPLMAWNLKPSDVVFCPSFTFVATAQVVPWLGSIPCFVDIDPVTYTMDPASLEAAICAIRDETRLKPKVVIAVDLFGQPANYPEIRAICDRYGLKLIADSAQGFGCTLEARHPLHWADVTTTSFFPAKPLGCYGDGGAILTNDPELGDLCESLRVYGKAMPADIEARQFRHDPKYMSLRIGMNSRLDTIQAAVLLEKLKIFDEEIAARQQVAERYNEGLSGHVLSVPKVADGAQSVWAQYVVEVASRDALQDHLGAAGIPTAVYYPIPIHEQDFAVRYPRSPDGLPHTVAASTKVMALPMHPYLDPATQDRVVSAVSDFTR
ncbi:MAG: DegT/DnrJ/EryC1/StrS aminotransferase family protein [Pseudomonadota bacterium]